MIKKFIAPTIFHCPVQGPGKRSHIRIFLKYSLLLISMLLAVNTSYTQDKKLKVMVEDQQGNPVSGARVILLSTPDAAVITGDDGVASFNDPGNGLVKVMTGQMVKTAQVYEQDVRVVLYETDRIRQAGYGYTKEADKITSSMDVVYLEELAKSSLHNPEESLYGQLSGLAVLQNGGEPWNRAPDMFIRGRGTYNNSAMLVLVDGFERDLSALSLEEIESISVLKDGAALAMYGQRGANGVLLVTTRQGEKNSFHVDVSLDRGMNSPFRMPQFLDGYSYAQAVNEASALDGNPFVYSEWDLQNFQDGSQPYFFPNVDWVAETLGDHGLMTNFNTNFRGGGESVTYFVSLNYQNETGFLNNTTLDNRYDSQMKYDRFNFRTNLNLDLTKTTSFLVNVAGNIDGRKEPGARLSNIMYAIYRVPSGAFPVESVNGVWGGTEYYDNNPVALVSSTGLRKPHSRGISANATLSQDLASWLPGLSAELSVAYDNQVSYWENLLREFLYESATVSRNPTTGVITDTLVNSYGSDTDITASDNFGGQRRHATLYGKINYSRSWNESELNTSLFYHEDKRVSQGQYNTYLHQNMAAFVSYGLKNRYFLDGVLSYSGSSVLPSSERFGFFPAISGAWLINREQFMSGLRAVDNLKLRASWGLSGNDRMAYNLYDQAFSNGGGYFFTDNNNSFGGIREGQLPTMGLSYEKASKSNLGIDLELIGKLQMTAELFYEKRTDILTSANGSVPSLIGVARPMENLGIVENKGAETTLLWQDKIGGLKYHIGGMFSFARNTILEMNEDFKPYEYLEQTGQPVGQQFGLVALGFFADQEDIDNSPRQLFSEVRPGDIKYDDRNEDGVIDQLDRVPVGFAGGYPEMYFSSTIGFEFRGFGVEALFQGIANQTLYLNTPGVFWPLRGQTSITTFSSDRWTPFTTETATLPRLSLLENANNYQENDIWLTEADYLKLRRLEFYYNLPAILLKRINMKSAKVYVRGMNLFSLDTIDVMDPEQTGISYPTLTSWHVGINLGF